MANNSVRSNIDPSQIIGTIKLQLGADIEKKCICLVVEGDDDRKALKKHISSNVTIYESFSGCNGVQEIINNEYINDERVVGIRDKDYTIPIESERLFFYDKSCLEMMILSFPTTFNSIYHEFYNGNLSEDSLKEKLFKDLFLLSLFRKNNEESNLEICFEGLSPSKYLNGNLDFDLNALVQELKNRSRNCSICLDTLSADLNNIQAPMDFEEFFEYTNGHDFIWIFQHHCNTSSCKKGVSDKTIASTLRTSFSFDLMKNTNLFSQINQYCNMHNKVFWKAIAI